MPALLIREDGLFGNRNFLFESAGRKWVRYRGGAARPDLRGERSPRPPRAAVHHLATGGRMILGHGATGARGLVADKAAPCGAFAEPVI